MNTQPKLWGVLARALAGAPFVQVGKYFFNVLSIERAYHIEASGCWDIYLTNNAFMTMTAEDAAPLADAFAEAPFAQFAPHVPSKAYFNVGCATLFELHNDRLHVKLMSGADIIVSDVDAFSAHLESALMRAQLMMAGNQKGKQR